MDKGNLTMKELFACRSRRALVNGLAVLLSCIAHVPQSLAAETDSPVPDGTATAGPGVNLALVAEAATSYVSEDSTIKALNDGHDPKHSRDRSHRFYHNRPRKDIQWVQYEWSHPISTRRIDVYWWDDRRDIRVPKAYRLLYWDGKEFVPVRNPSGPAPVKNQYNTKTFDELRASKLRLEIDSDGEHSTGILEWKVYDTGKSPDLPPLVGVGVDRVVVLGGKTYLTGTLKPSDRKDGVPTIVTWRKASGPGKVSFAEAHAPDSTATFSAVGDYVLKLTAAKGPLSNSSSLAVKVVPRPPRTPLDPVDTRKFKIDSPLWNSRAKALIVNWMPHCISKISDPDLREGGINNFIKAAAALAGGPRKGHRGYVFSNAWVFNTIESICVALMLDPRGDREIMKAQEGMKAALADWIPKVLAAQEPDGYLQTAFTLSNRTHWNPGGRRAHEGYVAGYYLEAGIAHYMLTNGADTRLYDGAKKLADCWYDNLGPPPKKPWYDGHQAMEMALVHFGRFVNRVEGRGTGSKYISLAKFLLDSRKDGRGEYNQTHLPVIRQYEAVGHAVRAVYSYAGMADVALETGNLDYLSAVMSLWDNIVHRKYYVTGGVGSGETGEGFGPNYSLRHNAYCESCSSCGEIFFQHRLHRIYHEAKYADLYEETLYNALLGSTDLAGKEFYYPNPLVSNRDRYPWHRCPCCVGNIPRTLLMLPTWTYSKSKDSIYVNLFIGSTVTIEDIARTRVEMVQVTDYPWSGAVSITVNPAAERGFSVRVRSPRRSVSDLYTATPSSDGITSIALNGSEIKPPVEKGYAVITRKWKPGDKIDLVLPMKIQRIKGIDGIDATRGQVALRYGPLIYCAETVDQDLEKAPVAESALSTEWRADLLGGVMVIKGTWADGSPLTAIPYYARDNRNADNPTDRRAYCSSVWLKDQ